ESFSVPSISARDRCASSLTSFGGAAVVVSADEPLHATVRRENAQGARSALYRYLAVHMSPSPNSVKRAARCGRCYRSFMRGEDGKGEERDGLKAVPTTIWSSGRKTSVANGR